MSVALSVRTLPGATPVSAAQRSIWESVRYRVLLPLTARSRRAGALYAKMCAAMEWRLDAQRRDVAVRRIERCLGVDARRASDIFWRALASEAREEADTRWFMGHPRALHNAFHVPSAACPDAGPAVWATLHLGSPGFAFVYLRCLRGIDVRMVARPLDQSNPMHEAKRAWGRRKVHWLEQVTDAAFLGVSAEATSVARSHVVRGGSLFLSIDVPGDIVARSIELDLLGERVRLALGAFQLAAMLGVPIRPIVALPRETAFEVRYGQAIEPVRSGLPTQAIEAAIGGVVQEFPDEWWLWPYLPAAA